VDAAAAKALAEKSGNSFQCKVANYFRGLDWAVALSPYYVDQSTDKIRESDLVVERSYPVKTYYAASPPQSLRIRLFIECKYVTEGAVFWMDAMDKVQAEKWVFTRTPIIKDHQRTKEHHYFQTNDPVAKLSACDTKKGEENDPIYKGLNQCLNGTINHGLTLPSMISKLPKEETKEVDYPVIVFSDFRKYYWTSVSNPADPVPVARNFLFEVDYAYINRHRAFARDYFLVDMVDFTRIDAFIKSIDAEAAAACFMLERH
jgi:hypothetical protein